MDRADETDASAEALSERVRQFIGSPEGMGKAAKEPPKALTLRRRVLTRDGALEEREVVLEGYLGSGLGSVVYKGRCGGKPIVEKLATGLSSAGVRHGLGKKLMEMVFVFFRQAKPSYRTNFYAAMANHFASRIVEDASEFEFGEPIIPRIQYTAYDARCGGYVTAYEFVEGRHIRPGPEEALLKKKLGEWKAFIAGKLGLWGLARQCDAKNINSPGNVFVVDEKSGKMRLIDITPGVLGGQIYLLPLELHYFLKGIATGAFLPFGDAVDLNKLKEYQRTVSEKAPDPAGRFGQDRVSAFTENCRSFEFYNRRWRDSEPMLLQSPFRIFRYLFDLGTVKATTRTLAAHLEYEGVIAPGAARAVREKARASTALLTVGSLRAWLLIQFLLHVLGALPRKLWATMKFLCVNLLWGGLRALARLFRWLGRIYTDGEFRKQYALQKISAWLDVYQNSLHWITEDEARVIRREAENSSILDVLQLAPLWTVVKVFKPPFLGTAANLAILYMFFHTLNPGWLIALFADGVIRFVIAVAFTRFRYKPLLVLCLLPTLGYALPIPVQIMKDTPHLAAFLVREVIGTHIGAFFPGIDRHSFRVYFYIRCMNILLFLVRILSRAFELIPFFSRITGSKNPAA